MDLRRVALGLQRGSIKMAERFKEEALKRGEELEHQELGGYAKNLLQRTQATLRAKGDRVAEDALMYSTLFQNFAKTNFK